MKILIVFRNQNNQKKTFRNIHTQQCQISLTASGGKTWGKALKS